MTPPSVDFAVAFVLRLFEGGSLVLPDAPTVRGRCVRAVRSEEASSDAADAVSAREALIQRAGLCVGAHLVREQFSDDEAAGILAICGKSVRPAQVQALVFWWVQQHTLGETTMALLELARKGWPV